MKNTNSDTSKANSFMDISITSPSSSTSRRRSKITQNPATILDLIEDPILSNKCVSFNENFDESDVDSDDHSKFDVDDEYVEDEVNKNIEDWCTSTVEEHTVGHDTGRNFRK